MRLNLFFYSACGSIQGSAQNEVTETIGFGQVTDSAQEDEGKLLTIRLSPLRQEENITGWIVPLTISQYRNYTFVTQRIVSDEVESAINATNDPAERKCIFVYID